MRVNEKYCGWTNYETWLTALWMGEEDNEYILDILATEFKKSDATLPQEERLEGISSALGLILKEQLAYQAEELFNCDNGLLNDLLGAALSEIDWYEIVEHIMEDNLAEMLEFYPSEYVEEAVEES